MTCSFCQMNERLHAGHLGEYQPQPERHNCELFNILQAEFGAKDYQDAAKLLRSLKAKIQHQERTLKSLAENNDKLRRENGELARLKDNIESMVEKYRQIVSA